MKMVNLTIRIKKNDKIDGKLLHLVLLEMLIRAGIAGATTWTGINGFGKRGKSTLHIEGIRINMPLIIEVIDEQKKIQQIVPDLKKIIGENGLITQNKVEVL